MDPNEIARLVEDLQNCPDVENKVINISHEAADAGRKNLAQSLVGKVFSAKAINRETLRTQLPRILQAKGAIDIEVVGDNHFVAIFSSVSDRTRAMEDGPWHFFQSLLLFKEVRDLQNSVDVDFDEFQIWVQLHNLPVAYMHPQIVSEIGSSVGRVIEVDVGDGGHCLGKYARVRVGISISMPLQSGVFVSLDEGSPKKLIILMYEKLPDFCYGCGRLCHVVRDCTAAQIDKEKLPFGNWMKAKKEHEGRRTRVTHPDSEIQNEKESREKIILDGPINNRTQVTTEAKKATKKVLDVNRSKKDALGAKNSVPHNRSYDWKKRAREGPPLVPYSPDGHEETSSRDDTGTNKRLKSIGVMNEGTSSDTGAKSHTYFDLTAEVAKQPRRQQ